MFQYTIVKTMTVEELLKNEWQLGKKLVHELRMQKAIRYLDGTIVRWNERIEKNTILQFHMSTPKSNYKPTTECEVAICYEDEHCLIVEKPKGMTTHPNDKEETNSCMNHVMAHILANGSTYAEHVHRLDQGTGGLLLIAKHPIAKSIFDRMIEEKKIIRIYEAEVQGIVKQNSGTINAPIGKDRHHGSRRIVSKSGQHAVSHYTVVKRHKNSTVVHVKLETGRTHQIRVHMAHIGYPIIGDTLYNGQKTSNNQYRLRAIKLIFQHPFYHKQMTIQSERGWDKTLAK